MQRELELSLIERALANISARKSDGEGEPFELGVDRYLDGSRLARELALLRRLPVVVGFSSELDAPGRWVTRDPAGIPLLLVRDADGRARAFLNACRHRGAKLACAPAGSGKSFTCSYHGWSYDLTGKLTAVPHRRELDGACLEGRNLVELACGERLGLVFASLTNGEPLSLERVLGPFAEDLESYGFGSHVLYAPSVRTRKLNWKLLLDGSFETYHFRTTHERTIAPYFFDNTGVFDWHEPNLRMVLPKRSILSLSETERSSWRLRDHANIIYSIFPNTIVLVEPDHAMVLTVWPLAAETCSIAGGMLIPAAPESESEHEHWRKNERIFWQAIDEDLEMGERIQQTLASGANTSLLFGRNEHLVAKYHQALERAGAQSHSPHGAQ